MYKMSYCKHRVYKKGDVSFKTVNGAKVFICPRCWYYNTGLIRG